MGGSLVVRNASGDFQAVGIVSWGIGCIVCFPEVYMRVSFFLEWIDSTVPASERGDVV